MTRTIAIALLILLVQEVPARAGTQAEGPRVLVRSTLDDPRAAERCRAVCENALAVLESALPLKLPEGEKIVVDIYADRKEYAAACQEIGAQDLVDNLACTSRKTRESYLAIVPRSDPAYLSLVGGLSELMTFLVSHEVVHQLIYRAGTLATYSWWPDWFAEGMADYLAEQCVRALEQKAASAPIPCVDDKLAIACDRQERGTLLSLPRLLHEPFARFTPVSAIYAQAYSFYRFLALDHGRLARLLASFEETGGPAAQEDDPQARFTYARACARALARIYGPLPDLEKRWKDDLARAAPRFREYLHAADFAGDEIVCASYPGLASCLLANAKPEARDGVIAISCEVALPNQDGKGEADFYLAHDPEEDRYLRVALGVDGSGNGFLVLMAYEDGHWQDQFRYAVSIPLSTLSDWTSVKVTARKEAIGVWVSGKHLFEAVVPPGFDPLEGRVGIGCFDGVARFRKLELGR